jgi:hypothetical protein
VSSGKLRRVALVRTDVSEELSASFIGMTRICELGTTLAVTSNRRTLRRNRKLYNGEFHNLYSSPSIIRIIKSRRIRWAGHVARMGEKRNVYR